MRALSLGWGTQSFGLAAMVALGELPPVDVAIHADTTHEAAGTYAFAAKWTPWLEEHGVRVVTVQPSHPEIVRQFANTKSAIIPAFTGGATHGTIERQCTRDWKIAPIHRWLQANRNGQRVEQLIGISVDEITRMKPSRVGYIENRWPLVELGFRRPQIVAWLREHGLDVPPRSACYFCPFHSPAEWRNIKDSTDWPRVIEVDEMIRHSREPRREPVPLFLHGSRLPISEFDFRSEQEHGQLELWDNECEGMCGI